MHPLGSSLAGQLDLAIEMQKTHCEAFADHNNTFDDVTIAKWTTMVTDWEADPEKPNPYDEPETCKFDTCINQTIYHANTTQKP